MKSKLPALLATATLVLFAACGKAPDSGTAGNEKNPTSNSAPAQEAPDPSLPEVKVGIIGNDQMKYDVTTIEAKPGQKVTVTLKNGGTMPKVSMGHNFVLLAPGMDPMQFVEAGTPYMGKDCIAPELANKVLAHTKLLGPGESDTISFAAPRKPATYTYICSFPGHCAIGMKGTLTVL
jgi:azurin